VLVFDNQLYICMKGLICFLVHPLQLLLQLHYFSIGWGVRQNHLLSNGRRSRLEMTIHCQCKWSIDTLQNVSAKVQPAPLYMWMIGQNKELIAQYHGQSIQGFERRKGNKLLQPLWGPNLLLCLSMILFLLILFGKRTQWQKRIGRLNHWGIPDNNAKLSNDRSITAKKETK